MKCKCEEYSGNNTIETRIKAKSRIIFDGILEMENELMSLFKEGHIDRDVLYNGRNAIDKLKENLINTSDNITGGR